MGRVLTPNNKIKFEINDKQDCILYLGHVIEYFEKKKNIYLNLIKENINYLKHELEKNNIEINDIEDIINFITDNRNFDFDINFYEFKLFNSSINLIKNEMINVIGDFSKDKISISYNNYLDIIRNKNIKGVKFNYNKERKEIIDNFNTSRNFLYHFSSDKLCEWIAYRQEQIKKYKNLDFEFGKEFNIYISDVIPCKVFLDELRINISFYEEAKKISYFMKKDFESLIGEEVNINIKKGHFDFSAKDITYRGFESHKNSKKRNNK